MRVLYPAGLATLALAVGLGMSACSSSSSGTTGTAAANFVTGGTLTEAERRGFAVFSDPKKGNCFACHYSGAGLGGSVAMFTDYSYEAIGVPRNRDIAENRDSG